MGSTAGLSARSYDRDMSRSIVDAVRRKLARILWPGLKTVPELHAIAAHNDRVHAAWSKLKCPGCGGSLTAGFGILPNEPMNQDRPPALCWNCHVVKSGLYKPIQETPESKLWG